TAGRGADAIAHVKDAMRDVHRAFPDIKFTIEDAAESGDTIWVRVRGRGTATGPYFGPPSGRPVDFTVIDVCRVVGRRIVEHWGVADRFAVLAQTGVLDRLAACPGDRRVLLGSVRSRDHNGPWGVRINRWRMAE